MGQGVGIHRLAARRAPRRGEHVPLAGCEGVTPLTAARRSPMSSVSWIASLMIESASGVSGTA